MEIDRSQSIIAGSGTTLLATMLLAGFAWCSSAIGATTNKADCGTFSKTSVRSESPAAAFSLISVDHGQRHVQNAAIETLEVEDVASDSAAPFLYLTPRVASVLREIFDAVRTDVTVQSNKDVISSPVADTDKSSDAEAQSGDYGDFFLNSPVDGDVDLPMLQRQMFRTDI